MTEAISFINNVIVHICQILAMIVILIGILKALIIYIKDILLTKKAFSALQESRLEIGQLAAIIAIRTALNFFLLRDVESLFKKKKH